MTGSLAFGFMIVVNLGTGFGHVVKIPRSADAEQIGDFSLAIGDLHNRLHASGRLS
jgi:hypothetical protein